MHSIDCDEQSRFDRVVLLLGNRPHNINTLEVLINEDVEIAAVIIGNSDGWKYKISRIIKAFNRIGISGVLSVGVTRLLDFVINGRRNRQWYIDRFRKTANYEELLNKVPYVLRVGSYSDVEVVKAFESLQPNYIVVHTQLWVPKWIRNFQSVKLCLGGHPGDTRLFRGAHSTFWSQVNGLKNTLAYSVFEIDSGVDTGAVYAAGTIDNLDRDTFQISSWKLMEVIAAEQATIINNYLRGSDRPKVLWNGSQDKITEFGQPTFFAYLRYQLHIIKESIY
jgi:predicted phosphohydrolase